jgi:hypothetical protein
MSNPLIQMRQLREQQRQLEEAIRNLENNPQLKAELEFETEFRALLSKHGKTLEEAVQVMDPDLRLVTSAVLEGRKLRAKRRTPEELAAAGIPQRKGTVGKDRVVAPVGPVYQYTNPFSGEQIITANVALHRVGKLWIAEHGKDEVKSWGVLTEVQAA